MIRVEEDFAGMRRDIALAISEFDNLVKERNIW